MYEKLTPRRHLSNYVNSRCILFLHFFSFTPDCFQLFTSNQCFFSCSFLSQNSTESIIECPSTVSKRVESEKLKKIIASHQKLTRLNFKVSICNHLKCNASCISIACLPANPQFKRLTKGICQNQKKRREITQVKRYRNR